MNRKLYSKLALAVSAAMLISTMPVATLAQDIQVSMQTKGAVAPYAGTSAGGADAIAIAAVNPTVVTVPSAGAGSIGSMGASSASWPSIMPGSAGAPTPAVGPTTEADTDHEPVEVSVTKEKAEELVRKVLNIPEDYVLQSVRFSSNWYAGDDRSWSLEFTKKDNGKFAGSIYASVHADSGQLLQYSSYTNNPNAKPAYPLAVDREAAGKIAQDFMNTVAPNYKDQVQYNEENGVELLPPLTGAVQHRLRYDRIVHGIPYLDNFIEMVVDSEGHIMSYTLVWNDNIKFPKYDQILTVEQAKEKLRENAKLHLSYVVPYDAKGKRKPMLSYELLPGTINAVTGELGDQYHYGYYWNDALAEKPVSDLPLGVTPRTRTVTESQATQIIQSAFKLPEDAVLSGANYVEWYNEAAGKMESSWNMSWNMKMDDQYVGGVYGNVNASTGSITNFNNYSYHEKQSGENKISLEQAMNLAEETVKLHLPWLTHQLYMVKPDPKQYEDRIDQPTRYYISFQRKVHGAAVQYDSISVSIDAVTGNIVGFDSYISSYAYPSQAPKLISEAQVLDKWFDYYNIQLTYQLIPHAVGDQPIPIEKYNVLLAAGEIRPGDVSSSNEAELVYYLTPKLIHESVFLDGETGDWRSSSTGEVTPLERPRAQDIQGHWAEHQLELMVAYKALDIQDGKVRPNQEVTRGEMIKMLVLTRNSGYPPILYRAEMASADQSKASFNDVAVNSDYFVYVESALEQNLIDLGDGSFNPEGKVSRDDMAELLVRALGYNTLANYDHIFNNTFADVDQIENKGQTSIVVGLNIMSLTDGKFQPKKQVTRAEAATAFFRYLQARSDLQEAPLRM